MESRTGALIGLVVLTPVLWMLGTSRPAADIAIDCDAGGSINAALETVRPGDTLRVTGVCNENVVIGAEVERITIDGQGTATIRGPVATRAVVGVDGRVITIRGFTLTGGRNGINVLRGATAYIDGNTIRNVGGGSQPGSGDGINLGQHSYAVVVNNTIEDNPANGIAVHENSSARIGLSDVDGTTPRSNVIRNNRVGILLVRSASARIAGNTITGNHAGGVHVRAVSHALIADNVIAGNGGGGIDVAQNSGLDLGESTSSMLGRPNRTDAGAKNADVGIRCATGAYVEGRLGTLNGEKGATAADRTCLMNLQP